MEMYDYETSSVPKDKRRSIVNISVVTSGLAVAMSTLYTGQALAPSLTLFNSIIAVLCGCFILWVIMTLTGTIGVKTGYSTAFNARRCLGLKGSHLLSFIIAIPFLGWFAFQASFFGITVSLVMPDSFIFSPNVAAVWGGLLMTSTAVFGFKGLSVLSYIAIPFLYIYAIWGVYLSNSQEAITSLAKLVPTSEITLGAAITIVVGSYAVGAVNQGDISRYCKSAKQNSIASLIAMTCFSLSIIAGVLMIMSTNAENIMEATLVLGMGVTSLIFIVLLQWTSNDSNLYASALAVCNLKKLTKWKLTLIMGIFSSIIAGMNLYQYFGDFLSVLGTFIPAMAGIIAVDFYFFNSDKHSNLYVDDDSIPNYNIPGILTLLLTGTTTFILSKNGFNLVIDAIFSIILAALLYIFLTKTMSIIKTQKIKSEKSLD